MSGRQRISVMPSKEEASKKWEKKKKRQREDGENVGGDVRVSVGHDQSWPPTGAVNQATTEAANYREITHLAPLPCFAAGTGWGWGCTPTLSSALGPSYAHEWFINLHQSFPFRFIFSPTLSQKYPNVILLHCTESWRVAVVMFSMIFGGYLNQSYLQAGVSMVPQTQTQSCKKLKFFALKHQASLNLLDIINYLLTNAMTNMRLN